MHLAFVVVDGEHDESWSRFFKKLTQVLEDQYDLVFVSDRHNSIYAGLRTVYPEAKNGAYAVHLTRNVKDRFQKQKGLAYMVSKVAHAFTVKDFREAFQQIETFSPHCANYLRGIGISHWSRVHFKGRRYNIMSSNVAESLNAVVAKALEFPIVTMVDSMRMMLMRWFSSRRAKAEKHESVVTLEVEKLLMKHLAESSNCTVNPASRDIYQMNNINGHSFSVDTTRKTCTCKVFDTIGIPCPHAIAAVRVQGLSIT